jgi:hypothetical protein
MQSLHKNDLPKVAPPDSGDSGAVPPAVWHSAYVESPQAELHSEKIEMVVKDENCQFQRFCPDFLALRWLNERAIIRFPAQYSLNK